MQNERGFTLLELVVVTGVLGLLAAFVVPRMQTVIDRNKVFTTADLLAAQIREARLAAITRNTTYRVMFNCPAPGAMRMVELMGVAAVDDDPDRCVNEEPNDGPLVYVPPGVGFDGGDAVATLRVNGRGEFTSEGGGMPQNFSVSYGSMSRNVVVTATGRVRTPTS